MAFTPNLDKNVIWRRIRYDPTILSLMGLTGKSDLEIAKAIIKRSQYEDIATSQKRMCIYFRPSRTTGYDLWTENVLQVDVHVPSTHDYIAEQIQERVKVLLHRFIVNNRQLQFDGQLGELATMPGFVCIGSRFNYFATI
jgi:hypothetical protein